MKQTRMQCVGILYPLIFSHDVLYVITDTFYLKKATKLRDKLETSNAFLDKVRPLISSRLFDLFRFCTKVCLVVPFVTDINSIPDTRDNTFATKINFFYKYNIDISDLV